MKLFRSIRFNIVLGAVIALASAVGTFLPQMPFSPDKVDLYQSVHPVWFKILNSFNAFNIYQSWWFMGLLALMAFDIVVCKLWSHPPDIGATALPPEDTDEREAEKHLAQKEEALRLKPYQVFFDSNLSFESTAAAAESFFKKSGYAVHDEFKSSSGAAIVATRHRLQRWGSYISHIALVVILLGALLKALYGFVEMVPVLEGNTAAMKNRPWTLAVDKFTVHFYPGTLNPSLFSSVLRVQEGDRIIGAKTIRVNDPLDIHGVRFYQASWGAGGMFKNVTLDLDGTPLTLAQRVPKKVPGTPFTVEADVLMPDFTVADGHADTASLELKNPAVRFLFRVRGQEASPLWLFANDPHVCLKEKRDGSLEHADAPPFSLASFDPVLFSGIQVAYDPGYKFVVLGAILWVIGLFLLFFLHRRRLWILIEPEEGLKAKISMGAWSSRGPREFEKEFSRLTREMKALFSVNEIGGNHES